MTVADRLKALEDDLGEMMSMAIPPSSQFSVLRSLAAIRSEVEAVAKEMRGVENRVDRGHYTLGWADRLAKDGEDE